MLTSEAGNCNSQHWGFIVDVSTENSIGVKQDPWQGPMVLSTLWVNPQSGEKYPRGNYCLRGQRFGTHSTEENFRNPYYGRLAFTSYFNAGVRAWDITDPQGAVEAGFYVPAATNGTYMTNNGKSTPNAIAGTSSQADRARYYGVPCFFSMLLHRRRNAHDLALPKCPANPGPLNC